MNIRLVIKELGLLLCVLSACMVASNLATVVVHGDVEKAGSFWELMAAAGVGVLLGGTAWLFGRKSHAHLGRREAFLLVAMSWLIGAAVSALPFLFWAHFSPHAPEDHPFRTFTDCYFEAMSGLTTTGATILSEIQTVPDSLLLWRATMHWLGGLGIVVLFVAVLPSLGAGGKKLFKVEAPGPSHEGLRPHIRETARVLLLLYLSFTAAAILALLLTRQMGLFDAICHAFSAVSTGGFSTHDASVGYFDSTLVDLVIIFFMLIAGVNFAIFYQMTQGRFNVLWKDIELRVYLILKVAGIAIVTLVVVGKPITQTTGTTVDEASLGQAVVDSSFTTVALHTGTGFCTVDYAVWPYIAQAVLIGLMFIGGCAGSTAGGVKVIRVWITMKVLASELERAFRPNVVRPIKVGGSSLDNDMKLGAVVYFLGLILIGAFATIVIQYVEPDDGPCDALTSISATLSTLCNVGPGLGGIGARENYSWFQPASKWIMTVLMALGRLEVFAIVVLLTPRFWRGT